MKTFHVLILAGAILGAGWMLKPVPVEQVSQVELERREKLVRWVREESEKDMLRKASQCAASAGKTVDTLDRSDPKQEAVFHKCMWPEESRGRLRAVWDKICGVMR